MQISATSYLRRWRFVIATMSLLAVPATPSFAQLRFAGPANQADTGSVATTASSVSRAQFQPVENPPASGLELAPMVPPPGSEASLNAVAGNGDLPPAPPLGQSEGLPPGSVMQSMPTEVAPEWSQPAMLEPSITESFASDYDSQMIQGGTDTYSTRNWFRRGRWYSQQDLVVLMRTDIYSIVFSADQAALTGQSGMGTKTVAPSFTPGTRLSLGKFLGQDVSNRDHAVEFVFFGLFDYSDSARLSSSATDSLRTSLTPGTEWFTNDSIGLISNSLTGNPLSDSNIITPGFDNAQHHDLLYQSDLNSYEINYRVLNRPTRDHLALQSNGNWVRHEASSRIPSLILGMRSVSLNELLQFDATFSNPVVSGQHRVRTTNNMFGFQAGLDYTENHDTWSVGFRSKGGALYNFADRNLSTRVRDGDDVTLASQQLEKNNLAALIEAGLFATYQIRTNLTFRAAYDAMYITGIADAPQNAGLDPGFPPFEVTSDAVYHGASFGLEMLW